MAKSSRSEQEQQLNLVLQKLDQVEELLEYMDELEVDSRAEAEALMRDLNLRADRLESELSGA